MPVITNENVIPKVFVCNKYAIDVEPIPLSQRNNRNVQQGYLNRLKDTLDNLREIVEEARSKRKSDNSLEYACVYTKTSQELLENVIASCSKTVNKRDRYNASTHAKRNKHVTFAEPLETSPNNTSTHVKQLNEPKTNVPFKTRAKLSFSNTLCSPSKKYYEILFQQLFDEYFNPPPRAVSSVPAAVAAPRAVDPSGSLSSTTIDQDVQSVSTSPTTQEIQSQVTHQGAEEQIHGHQNAQFDNAPLFHNLSSNLSYEETTLQGFIPSNLHHLNQSFDTLTKLMMNHALENVICDPSRSVLTRSQLQGHAIWCYFDANDNPIPLVGNCVVEIYYLKGRIMVVDRYCMMYRGDYGDQYYHSSHEIPSFINQPQRPTQEYYYQGQRQSHDLSFDEKYDKLMSMIESNKEENQRYEASFAAYYASFVALETHIDRLLEQLNTYETYEPQGITMLDFDNEDEDEGEEQNEEFTLQSTNTMEWSAIGSCKDKEDADDHNNSFEDLISPIKEHDKESRLIDDIRSKEDEEFLALSLYEDECSNSLEEEQYPNEVEAEVTHIQNPPQLPRVAINQVGEDDSVFENKKEQEKVSLVKDEHHVVEQCHENSLKLTHIIVKQVHRKARVGVRKQILSLCHGKREFQEVLNSGKLIKFASKKPREKHVRIASNRRKRKRRV
uniref:Integrase, catalytic region, zinc finger, CCHC-type, peptidase aspartic, catalytic n=1 Tax=Tanacetum cinerariifolium TaxID=118510 RepID=A0A6L2KW54_TANCI|nr:hypothetical protein [Tanacetum cinerariifolium]